MKAPLRFLTSLRTHLVLLTFVAMLPALALTGYIGVTASNKEHARAQSEAYNIAEQASLQQDSLLNNSQQLLSVLAQDPAVSSAYEPACDNLLASLQQKHPEYTGLTVVNQNGDTLCSGSPLPQTINSADRTWFQRTVQSKDFAVGDYTVGRASGKPALVVGYPILDQQSNVQAVVAAGLDLSWLNKLAAESSLPKGATLTVFDRTGTILS